MPLVDTQAESEIRAELASARFGRAFDLAQSLMMRWELEEATRVLEDARRRGFSPPRMHHELSVLYAQQGFFAAALAEVEAALALEPLHRANWHHFLAIQKNNPAQPAASAWRAMHLAYADTLRERFDARHLSVARDRTPDRRLKVGYLCPDTHLATGRFIWPVLEHFDAAAFEVFVYWCHSPVTPAHESRYPKVAHRSILGANDEEIVASVLRDGIDVLVDIAGHGAGNALPALALRPAPVQLTWLDYLATTGLETVDARVGDAVADPPGAERAHVEALTRLPVPAWCYRPHWEAPAKPRAPRKAADVVFGSICVPLKLSDALLDAWAQLLARSPLGRLRFLGIPQGRARDRIVARFERAGIAAQRLEIHPRLEQQAFFEALTRIDIVLDSFPFSGATSTLDALWQGTPVVTLAGALAHGRSSASILTALGRTQWIAESAARYIDIAAGLAADEIERGAQHGVLRRDLERSALCDGPKFARAMGTVYREKWKEWIAAASAPIDARSRPTARADILLDAASRSAPASVALSETCRGLLEVLPSHRATSTLFWRDVGALAQRVEPAAAPRRVRLADHVDRVLLADGADIQARLAKGSAPWVLVSAPAHYLPETLEGSIPAELLDRCDALAPFGVDALVNGSLACAGRGHASGLAMVAGDDARLFLDAWVPQGMGACVALSGPCILVRRAFIDRAALPWRSVEREVDFRFGLVAWSHELFRKGARLGVACALAMADRTRVPDLAAEYDAERKLEQRFGLDRWSRETVAASPAKAVLSRAAWLKMLPSLETFCDISTDL